MQCTTFIATLPCAKEIHRSGLEPPTYGFVGRCSIQLSYRCKVLQTAKKNTPKWARTTNLRLRRPLLYPVELPVHKTKGEGFEPSMRNNPHTRLAGERLQPLGHPFSFNSLSVHSRMSSGIHGTSGLLRTSDVLSKFFFQKKASFLVTQDLARILGAIFLVCDQCKWPPRPIACGNTAFVRRLAAHTPPLLFFFEYRHANRTSFPTNTDVSRPISNNHDCIIARRVATRL